MTMRTCSMFVWIRCVTCCAGSSGVLRVQIWYVASSSGEAREKSDGFTFASPPSCDGRSCGLPRSQPSGRGTGGGRRLGAPSGVLKAFGVHNAYGSDAEDAEDPARALARARAMTQAGGLVGRMGPTAPFGSEAWGKAVRGTTGKVPMWQNGLAGLAAFNDPSRRKWWSDSMDWFRGTRACRPTLRWPGLCAYHIPGLPKSPSTGRSRWAPPLAAAERALLVEHQGRLAPRWLCAEGLVARGNADTHVLLINSIAENRCVGRGDVGAEGRP